MAELNLALLSAYVIAVLFLLLTPGPVVLLVTGTAARVGYTRAFLTLLGTNLASLVLITLAVLAIAGAVSLNKGYLALLGIGGSVFIGWGAVQSLREIWAQRPVQEGKAVLAGGFMRGFFTGISNPKDILFLSHFSRSLLPLAAILPPALPRFACCGSCSILPSWRAISLLSNVFSLSRKVDVLPPVRRSFYCYWPSVGLPGTLRARNRSLCDEMILSLPE
jgi:threonine/homoserine/homoserine lactone efflux protein